MKWNEEWLPEKLWSINALLKCLMLLRINYLCSFKSIRDKSKFYENY